ncbi:MAG: hypothetical protein ISP88_14435 [Pseudomonadales bacterium]|nr:hypothetical protein [Pseudomonadales bacterium]MBL6816202.1 hypothetical protein [Pseudomonadales bacterium]
MKISAINEGVSLIANIGVIGSIIFLGLEMQQNTEMMQSQTRNSIVENQLSVYDKMIENPELFDIADKLNTYIAQSYGTVDTTAASSANLDVTGAERRQLHIFILSQLRIWENEFYQYQIGLYAAEEFEARKIWWRKIIGIPANLQTWRSEEETFYPDFRIYMNELLDEIS